MATRTISLDELEPAVMEVLANSTTSEVAEVIQGLSKGPYNIQASANEIHLIFGRMLAEKLATVENAGTDHARARLTDEGRSKLAQRLSKTD
jgi:predicted transcriptional regulator